MWEVVRDIEGMGRFSPENTGGTWRSGTPGTVGAQFTGTNRHGFMRWTTHCTVVDVVDGRTFSFEVNEPKARWTFHLEPSGTGTMLTQTREIYATPALYVRFTSRSGLLGKNRDHLVQTGMETTLARIKAFLER